MAAGLRLFTESERTSDGAGEPVLDSEDGEELVHVQPGVSIALGSQPPESPGTLYISTKKVVWLSDSDRSKGYAVDFLSVSLHAVSRDPEAYPSPCIYTQIEIGAEDEESEGSDSEHDDVFDLEKVTEMRLVPSDPSQFFCECAELNPEPVEAEEEHNWVFSAEMDAEATGAEGEDFSGNSIGFSNGDHDLSHRVLED
ncbi:hypothetical protein RJ640_019412 [Escallonia rubra]|uniref:Chloride conductance regulatory protein ICln n=1 Tax=Escallonia rubra TaxID=112253 RepID=A0AA88U695_9ASTE|nr:hypothetical protein RJ640_019412 [Escallonia rubra]